MDEAARIAKGQVMDDATLIERLRAGADALRYVLNFAGSNSRVSTSPESAFDAGRWSAAYDIATAIRTLAQSGDAP